MRIGEIQTSIDYIYSPKADVNNFFCQYTLKPSLDIKAIILNMFEQGGSTDILLYILISDVE